MNFGAFMGGEDNGNRRGWGFGGSKKFKYSKLEVDPLVISKFAYLNDIILSLKKMSFPTSFIFEKINVL